MTRQDLRFSHQLAHKHEETKNPAIAAAGSAEGRRGTGESVVYKSCHGLRKLALGPSADLVLIQCRKIDLRTGQCREGTDDQDGCFGGGHRTLAQLVGGEVVEGCSLRCTHHRLNDLASHGPRSTPAVILVTDPQKHCWVNRVCDTYDLKTDCLCQQKTPPLLTGDGFK